MQDATRLAGVVPDAADNDSQLPPLAEAVKLVFGLAETLMDWEVAVVAPAVPLQDTVAGVAVNVFCAEIVNATEAR